MTESYESFTRAFFALAGFDLGCYKENQIRRRVDALMLRNGFSGYGEYLQQLKTHPELVRQFMDYVNINVSEFFRTQRHWVHLDERVLPDLVKRFGSRLRIWSAGCATGEEPYSIAMSLSRLVPLEDIAIIATDVDENALALAARGEYSASAMAHVPQEFRSRFFIRRGHSYCVTPALRSCVTFRRQDLLQDNYFPGCHLIVCRNMLIYLTETAKQRVFCGFYDALVPHGALFLGNA
ncbi:MAG: protein-glutamate O-methyltransferase CheR [Clostridia bacterium]|nr:protein-glutamate O-methyltransferase CheR [Clostridia bacterium]